MADGHDGQDSFANDLADLLLTQFCFGKMDAKTLCSICWLAAKAGARGDGLERLGYPPGRQTGKYSAHLKKFLPVDCSDLLQLEIPGHVKGLRGPMNVLMAQPHRVLEEEMLSLRSVGGDIEEKIKNTEWADSYFSHPKYIGEKSDRRAVVPLALYMDGVKYTRAIGPRQDSLLAITIYNIASGARHLLCTLAKRDLCRCGCRSFCSTFPVFEAIRWSLEVYGITINQTPRTLGRDNSNQNKNFEQEHVLPYCTVRAPLDSPPVVFTNMSCVVVCFAWKRLFSKHGIVMPVRRPLSARSRRSTYMAVRYHLAKVLCSRAQQWRTDTSWCR